MTESDSTTSPATHADVAKVLPTLQRFIGNGQLETMLSCSGGEEGQFFRDKMVAIAYQIMNMPKTYDTDGQGDNAVCHLHYFFGASDWYISEKDMEDEQWQAFGFAILNGDIGCAELGYIPIPELIACGVELDLYWAPKTLREVKREKGIA